MRLSTIKKVVRNTVSMALMLTLLFSVLQFIQFPKAHAETGITNIGHLGGYDSPPLGKPRDVAIASNGDIFVTDGDHNCIRKYGSSGNYITTIGSEGSGDGQLNGVLGIALDSNNNIYVVDSFNSRIQKFSSTGDYVSKWGVNGYGNGEFNTAQSLTITSTDEIYVTDYGRVQKFDSNGTYISQFGSFGSGNGELNAPNGIEVDQSGNIYVVDTGNDRVQKFNSAGSYVSQFGTNGSGNGAFNSPRGIAIDSIGNMYVTDSSNNRVQKFNSSGTFITKWGSSGVDDSQFSGLEGITVDASNKVYVTDVDNTRVQKFNSTGTFEVMIVSGEGKNGLVYPYDVDVDQQGSIYAANVGNGRIVKFKPNNDFDKKWISNSGRPPYGVSVAGQVVYAVAPNEDSTEMVIKKTDLDGNPISEWGTGGIGYGVAIDSQSNIFFVDVSTGHITKFDTNGTQLAQWGSLGTGDGEIDMGNFPSYMTVDMEDNLYIADTGNHRVQKFSNSGTFIAKWGTVGTGDGEFSNPSAVTADEQNNIYVSDVGNDGPSRIQKFSADGQYLTQYTQADDEYTLSPFYPFGLASAGNGKIYATNTASNRIEILCDHDVSLNDCADDSVDNPEGENSVIITGGQKAFLQAPQGSTLTAFSAVPAAGLPEDKEHVSYNYPLGLVSFTLDGVDQGASKQIELYFQTSLKPEDVTPRKYHTNSKTYQEIPGVVVTSSEKEGLPALKVTYTIQDGGALDQDGAANGTIVDPVGLAVENRGLLANTGIVVFLAAPIGLLMISGALFTYIDYRKHKKPLMDAEPEIAKTYTYWHHIRVVSVPLVRYRITVALVRKQKPVVVG